MPEIERLDEMCVLISGDQKACFANLTNVQQRITVIDMAMKSELNDALQHVGTWFDLSNLWEGRVS